MNESIQSTKRLATILHYPEAYLLDLSKRCARYYRPYRQEKKNGKYRIIDNPNDELKLVQKRIEHIILRPAICNLPPYMHGARVGKSAITNASMHLDNEAIFALDLENCFPNIKRDMVYELFKNEFHCIPKVAKILTRITTRNHGLPQGAPTSSSICNLILAPTCKRINAEYQRKNCTFSQYIDDMFASGKLEDIMEMQAIAINIVKEEGLKLNKKKLRIMTGDKPMAVTGTFLNTRQLTAGRTRIRSIRQEIHNLNDYDEYEVYYKNGEPKKKYKRNVLIGKINSVKAINKQQGKKLKRQFNKKLNELKSSKNKNG